MLDSLTNIINDVYRLNETTSPNHIDKELTNLALKSERKQSRICLHKTNNDPIHIMYICHLKNCKVRIHKHTDFPEWLIFLKAKANILYFNEDGKELKRIRINTENNSPIFHFIPKDIFHTLKFDDDSFFIEVKQGPFNKEATDFLFKFQK